MKNIFLILTLALVLGSCGGNTQYDGMIVKDQTGKIYLIEHRVGDCYFINPQVVSVVGVDTVHYFKMGR